MSMLPRGSPSFWSGTRSLVTWLFACASMMCAHFPEPSYPDEAAAWRWRGRRGARRVAVAHRVAAAPASRGDSAGRAVSGCPAGSAESALVQAATVLPRAVGVRPLRLIGYVTVDVPGRCTQFETGRFGRLSGARRR